MENKTKQKPLRFSDLLFGSLDLINSGECRNINFKNLHKV